MRVRRVGWVIAAAAMAFAAPVEALQTWERGDEGWCERDWQGGDRARFCDALTAVIDAPRSIDIDGGANGGVSVEGWSRDEVEIRAKVWARAGDMERAEGLAREVRVTARDGYIEADGPRTGRRESWGVSFELRVPYDMDIEARTRNGGVSIEDVRGDISFSALNGGVHLTGVGGDVRGRTTNGGLHIELDGDRWDGEGLDVETTNGGVTLYIPDGYDGELETGTVNGGFDIDFPVTVQGRIGRRLRTTLGEGGPRIRAVTTNGGVRIARGVRANRPN